MNHVNVLLQSLYNACPLRNAVFEKPKSSEEISESFLIKNPIELIFAKIHYDMENGGDATEASIYFKNSYLKTVVSDDKKPIDFYSWITRDLFESPKFRKLLQWDFLTVKRTIQTGSEVFIEEQSDVLTIETGEFQSIQKYLDDLFERKYENIIVTVDGESCEKTVEIFKELTNTPTIATFLIEKNENDIKIEDKISLFDEKEFNLDAVIIFDPQESKYSTLVKGTDSFWYRIQDDSFVTKITQETVLISASKFGYMLFYIDANCGSASCSPKPSQQLIIESLTKNTIHTISKTIQKQSNSPPLKPLALPTKSKNMLNNQLSYPFGEASPSTLRSASILSLPAFPLTKTPPPVELAQLEAILVPADLSNVKMNLVTTGSFHQSESIDTQNEESVGIEEIEKGNIKRTNSFNDIGDFELEYFEEVPKKSETVWSQHYLNQTPTKTEHRRDLFAGLLDFELEFHETHAAPTANYQVKFDEKDAEEEAELFIQASLAKIRKSRSGNEESKTLNTKNQQKKSAKIQKAHSILSSGLFYRATKSSILPLTTSSDKLTTSKSADQEEKYNDGKTTEPKKKNSKKTTNRYAKF